MVIARRIFLALLLALAAGAVPAQERFIVVASTTSTEQSGLFGFLLPIFEKETGIKVRVVALGTGQALDLARRGDADVVFVHAKAAEEKFLAEGEGVKRFPVMYNDFVLIGPKSDPAKIAGGKDIVEALKKIQATQAPFVSRGDKSGTHMAELDLWKVSGIDLEKAKGPWYRDTGQGMGPALNTAASMNAYLLADRGTWLAFKNRGDLGDRRRGRQAALQPVRRDARQSGQASDRQEGSRADLRRLGRLAGGPEGDRRLQDRRRAALLSQRRTVRRMKPGAAVVALCALATVATLAAPTSAETAAPPARKLAVVGNVANPLALGVEDLARMPVQVVEDVRQVRISGAAASGGEAVRRYRGVLLRDVLAAAKPLERERHDLRQSIVVATATDGYKAVFSWAELMLSPIGDGAFVIFERDGAPLAPQRGAAGARLAPRYATRAAPRQVAREDRAFAHPRLKLPPGGGHNRWA